MSAAKKSAKKPSPDRAAPAPSAPASGSVTASAPVSGASSASPSLASVWLVCAALFFGTFLLFSRALGNGFVNYDDPDYVTHNLHVRAGLSAETVKWAFTTTEFSYWHPLTWLSHALDWQLFGDKPAGHHAVSVFWHSLNAVLAFLVLRRLTGAFWSCALAAALFAWHPLRVESVAWIAERKDVLSLFFWLLALWGYAGYAAQRRAGKTGAGAYALTLVAFAGGLMSKPTVVTLPCVLLLLDFWPLRRLTWPLDKNALPLLLEKLPFFALVAAAARLTLQAQTDVGTLSHALSFGARLANAAVAVPRYLGKFFLPVRLAVLYPHPGYWPMAAVAVATLLVIVFTGLALLAWRRRPWLTVGWLWFLGTLVPMSGLTQVGIQSMADRYTYIPMIGLVLALVWTAREWVTPGTRPMWAAIAAIVLAGCAARTVDQLGVWKSSFTLFDHAIAVTDRNYLAYGNRGIAQLEAGHRAEGIEDYRQSLAINPDYPESNNNLGRELDLAGQSREALPYLRKAVALKPHVAGMRNNLANALADAGELDEAIAIYHELLAETPDSADVLDNYGVALAMQGHAPEAIAQFEKALRLAPDRESVHSNLGNALSMSGQHDQAIAHYRRALELSPDDSRTRNNLGIEYMRQGRFPDAIASYQEAIRLEPNNPEAHANLGYAFMQSGRRDEAAAELRLALRQRPGFGPAQTWLDALEKAPPPPASTK